MSTYFYEQVSVQGRKSGTCPVCGHPARRQKVFTNTVNPFNKNADGTVKTRAEVHVDVRALWREWISTPVLHAGCES